MTNIVDSKSCPHGVKHIPTRSCGEWGCGYSYHLNDCVSSAGEAACEGHKFYSLMRDLGKTAPGSIERAPITKELLKNHKARVASFFKKEVAK